jgi:hypothetical protein
MSEKQPVKVDEQDRVLLEAAKNAGLHHAYGVNHTKGNFSVHGVAVGVANFPDHTDEEDRIYCIGGVWIVGGGG